MDLIISARSPEPIYEQIARQLKQRILGGELGPGAPLPSMRALAKDLRISVITVQKAYEMLTAQGLIDTSAGKGCFVSGASEGLLREEEHRQLEALLEEAAGKARALGLTLSSAQDLLRLFYEGGEDL